MTVPDDIKRASGSDITRIRPTGLVTLVIVFKPTMDVLSQPSPDGAAVMVIKEHVNVLPLATAIDVNGDQALVGFFMTSVESVYRRRCLLQPRGLVERNTLVGIGYFVVIELQHRVVSNAIIRVLHHHVHRGSLLLQHLRQPDGDVISVLVFGQQMAAKSTNGSRIRPAMTRSQVKYSPTQGSAGQCRTYRLAAFRCENRLPDCFYRLFISFCSLALPGPDLLIRCFSDGWLCGWAGQRGKRGASGYRMGLCQAGAGAGSANQ